MPWRVSHPFIRRTRGISAAVSSVAGMSVNSGTVPGNCKVIRWYETAWKRRQDSDKIESFLKACFKIEKDIFSIEKAPGQLFRDLRFCFRSFLSHAFGLSWFFEIPGSRKKFFTGVEIGRESPPKPVHEIIIRAERRQGMAGASDE